MKKIDKNWLEWSVFGVSAVLILIVLGFLVYENATIGDAPPDIQVELGTPEARPGYFAVPIRIANKGDETAKNVRIEVVLNLGGTKESADFEIQYMPRRGAREASATFKSDPGTGTLEARVLGYEKP